MTNAKQVRSIYVKKRIVHVHLRNMYACGKATLRACMTRQETGMPYISNIKTHA